MKRKPAKNNKEFSSISRGESYWRAYKRAHENPWPSDKPRKIYCSARTGLVLDGFDIVEAALKFATGKTREWLLSLEEDPEARRIRLIFEQFGDHTLTEAAKSSTALALDEIRARCEAEEGLMQ